MTINTYEWEKPLLSLASDVKDRFSLAKNDISYDDELLFWAYKYCGRVTRLHSRSFYTASSLLPKDKRNSARALYAFCRTTDDIVDHALGDGRADLNDWEHRVLGFNAPSHDVVPIAWNDTCNRYNIPIIYAKQLIDGVARDLDQSRYPTFQELTEYCYGVASTVGLMAMHIIGFKGKEALPYAIRLGVALQLTNILRDIAEDWQRGRLYLPLDELKAFNLGESDIDRGLVTEDWREFMRFQIARTRQLYEEAWPGLMMLAADGRVAIAAAADFYSAILGAIEAIDYDVFTHRAYVTGWGKIQRLPGLYWRTRLKPALSEWRKR